MPTATRSSCRDFKPAPRRRSAAASGRRADVEVVAVDCGPDVRTGLLARVRRNGTLYDVALADLTVGAESELRLVVAAYRRWQGR